MPMVGQGRGVTPVNMCDMASAGEGATVTVMLLLIVLI